MHILTGLFLGRSELPWTPATLIESVAVVPDRDVLACGSACARAVAASTSRGVGTSVTARILNANARFAAGRRRSGRPDGDGTPLPRLSTPRRSASAVSVPSPSPKYRLTPMLLRRVVT